MYFCEYINNLADISHLWFLILNTSQKGIGIGPNIDKIYTTYSIAVNIGPVLSDIHNVVFYNTMKVRYRNIKYPFITFTNIGYSLTIWEGKTANLDTLKEVKFIFS